VIKILTGNSDFIESLRGKRASFLLAMSYSRTCDIEGISYFSSFSNYHLKPPLDAEIITVGDIRSDISLLNDMTKYTPTPAFITRAIHQIMPFHNIELINLGVKSPEVEYFELYGFNFLPSGNITDGANIDAMDVFKKGLEFGKTYDIKDDYIVLAESVPSGTTSAEALARALGYDVKGCFATALKEKTQIREDAIKKALSKIEASDDIFAKASKVADNMLIFYAGVVLSLSYRTKIVLGGGTQMAALLLLINSIIDVMGGSFDSHNITLITTKWIAEDKNSDIKKLLNMLDFNINSYYSDFDFALSQLDGLKKYDSGEAKEGVGAGASLVYGELHGLDKLTITQSIDKTVLKIFQKYKEV
jgi:uncharacterized protein (TIGR00303 family)